MITALVSVVTVVTSFSYLIVEGRAHRRQVNRLLDAALSNNAAEFRVRQTTRPAAQEPSAPVARPNPPTPRALPIGLDGGAF